MNLLTGFFEESAELLLSHAAFQKTISNGHRDFSKGLLRKKLSFDQGPQILVSALSFALAQLLDGLSAVAIDVGGIDGRASKEKVSGGRSSRARRSLHNAAGARGFSCLSQSPK